VHTHCGQEYAKIPDMVGEALTHNCGQPLGKSKARLEKDLLEKPTIMTTELKMQIDARF
jgi:hypothetical protein